MQRKENDLYIPAGLEMALPFFYAFESNIFILLQRLTITMIGKNLNPKNLSNSVETVEKVQLLPFIEIRI